MSPRPTQPPRRLRRLPCLRRRGSADRRPFSTADEAISRRLHTHTHPLPLRLCHLRVYGMAMLHPVAAHTQSCRPAIANAHGSWCTKWGKQPYRISVAAPTQARDWHLTAPCHAELVRTHASAALPGGMPARRPACRRPTCATYQQATAWLRKAFVSFLRRLVPANVTHSANDTCAKTQRRTFPFQRRSQRINAFLLSRCKHCMRKTFVSTSGRHGEGRPRSRSGIVCERAGKAKGVRRRPDGWPAMRARQGRPCMGAGE
eukprot:349660-Chlamydomonas_euryale.AAC.5